MFTNRKADFLVGGGEQEEQEEQDWEKHEGPVYQIDWFTSASKGLNSNELQMVLMEYKVYSLM